MSSKWVSIISELTASELNYWRLFILVEQDPLSWYSHTAPDSVNLESGNRITKCKPLLGFGRAETLAEMLFCFQVPNTRISLEMLHCPAALTYAIKLLVKLWSNESAKIKATSNLHLWSQLKQNKPVELDQGLVRWNTALFMDFQITIFICIPTVWTESQ